MPSMTRGTRRRAPRAGVPAGENTASSPARARDRGSRRDRPFPPRAGDAAGAEPTPAVAEQAHPPHGTTQRYRRGPGQDGRPGTGCRCADCMRVNSKLSSHRSRMIAYGRWQPYVPAGCARVWVLMLQEYGIGWKRVAFLAGIGAGTVNGLLYGRGGRLVRRIRPATEAALLAVKPVLANLDDRAPVDATGTRRRLRALVAAGWPQRRLARRLGWQWAFFSAVINRRTRVTAGTARAVIALYDALWDQEPPQQTPAERGAVTKARSLAASRGWDLPQAWDDEAIDDPGATSAECRRLCERLPQAALIEDARELILGQGYTPGLAAERLGVSPAALTKAFQRSAHAATGVAAEPAA
jgi:hypothetical protein